MLELATDAFYRVQYEAMRDWAERARDSADERDDPSLTAAAGAALALACTCTGAIAEADGHRRHAAALIDALSDEELSSRLDAATSLATAEVYLDRYAEAERHCTRAIAVARATGQGALFPVLTVLLGAVTLMTGRPGEAAELLDGAVEAARLSGNDQVLALNLLNQAQAVLADGRRGHRDRPRGGERGARAGARRQPPRTLGGGGARRSAAGGARARARRRVAARSGRRREPLGDPQRIPRQRARAAGPLPARARPPGGRGACRGACCRGGCGARTRGRPVHGASRLRGSRARRGRRSERR